MNNKAEQHPIFIREGQGEERFVIGNDLQCVRIVQKGDGLQIITCVGQNEEAIPFFDSGLPLLQGENFDLVPTACQIAEDTATEKALLLEGETTGLYPFSIRITASLGSPLLHFLVSCQLQSDLLCEGRQPTSMLWAQQIPEEYVSVYQQTPNYQTYKDAVYWNSAFPAAYLWANGMESAVFFDMSAMDWFSFSTGINRFRSIQVRESVRDGKIGIGMDLRRTLGAGVKIAAGEMKVDFYLYGSRQQQRPAKMQALQTMVQQFGRCLPAASPHTAHDYITDAPPSYEYYTGRVAQQLQLEDITYRITPYSRLRNAIVDAEAGVWEDGPLFPEIKIQNMLRRPDYAVGNLNGHNLRTPEDIYGDWNCVNNTLIPWVAFERLHPNEAQRSMIDLGLQGLKVYYDPAARLVRSFECSEDYQNSYVEFGFQNFFFSINTLKAAQLRNRQDFDPGIAGKYLMGLSGLTEMAHNVNYAFPQLFTARKKTAATSIDETHLGKPFDVWTSAVYAYDMCMAYDYTGDEAYAGEAQRAVDTLFESLHFTVENEIFTDEFSDPYDYPVNEVSSAPWGVAAAHWLYHKTGDAKYLEYANHFKAITLRLMAWYESALRDDGVDRSVPSLALFHDFSVADTPSAWENIMTYLPLLMELKNTDIQQSELTLKLFNIYRTNGFWMHGPSWNPDDIGVYATNFTAHPANYMAVEDFYTAETPTAMGLSGPTVYMSNSSFYAYLMFEAFAKPSDEDILAVNVDYIDQPGEMLEGIQRNFVLYNPTGTSREFATTFPFLEAAESYTVVKKPYGGEETTTTYGGAALMDTGISLTLDAGAYLHLSLLLQEGEKRHAFENATRAQKALARAYQLLQEAARDIGIDDALLAQKAEYQDALALYAQGEYLSAATNGEQLVEAIPSPSAEDGRLLDTERLDLWDLRSDSNIAFHAYTSASSGLGDRAVDGKTGPDNTWVSAMGGSHFITLDFGAQQTFGSYRITHGQGDEITADFSVLSSNDKASWQLQDSVVDNTNPVTERTLLPFTARYIKLAVSKPAPSGRVYIQEIEFFSSDGTNSHNLALQAQLTASEGNAALVADGIVSAGSMWETTAGGELVMQWEAAREIGSYTLRHAGLVDMPEKTAAAFTLHSSDDGLQWALRDAVEGNTPPTPPGEGGNGGPSVTVDHPLDTGNTTEGGLTANAIQALQITGQFGENLKKRIEADLDATPSLTLRITGMEPGQNVHLQAWDETSDPVFLIDSPLDADGTYTIDLAARTGWSGEKSFYLILYPQAATAASFLLAALSLSGVQQQIPLNHLTYDAIDGQLTATPTGILHVEGKNLQNLKKAIAVDLKETPLLYVTFGGIAAGQSVHMQAWDGISDPIFLLDAPISAGGVYQINLAAKTGWSDQKDIQLIFYPQSGETLPFDLLALRSASDDAADTADKIDDDFSDLSLWRFKENASILDTPAGARVTCTAGSFGYVAKDASIDLTYYQRLQVQLAEVENGCRFHIMLNDGTGDRFLSRTEIIQPGEYNFDLPVITGWAGKKNVTVKLAVIGGNGCYATVAGLRTIAGPAVQNITNHPLAPFTAKYLKLTVTQPGTSGSAGICEWEVYPSEIPSYQTLAVRGEDVVVSTGPFHTASATRLVRCNLDNTPLLVVDIASKTEGAGWHLMLDDSLGNGVVALAPAAQTGRSTFNLQEITSRSGLYGFRLAIVVDGGTGESISVRAITLQSANS